MRLPHALQKLILMLRRWLGLEVATPPALAPGSSEGPAAAPALPAGDQSRSSPKGAVSRPQGGPASAAEAEPAVENEPEIVVEIEGADGPAAVDKVAAKSAAEPAPTPAPTPTPTPEAAPLAGSAPVLPIAERPEPKRAPGAAKRAPESRRRRRAAAYAQLEPALAVTPVRRFFSRLTVQESGLFSESPWPQVRVESFFLSLTQPRHDVLRGRGPAVAEPQALADAFADFVWD